MAIAWELAKHPSPLTTNVFDTFIGKLRQVLDLKRKQQEAISMLEDQDKLDNIPLARLKRKEKQLRETIGTLQQNIEIKKKQSKLDILSGPVTSNLDYILKQLYIP